MDLLLITVGLQVHISVFYVVKVIDVLVLEQHELFVLLCQLLVFLRLQMADGYVEGFTHCLLLAK